VGDPLRLEAQLPPQAAADLAVIRKKVGASRVEGPTRGPDEHELVLTRSSGKQVAFYGKTAAEVLSKAKAYVDQVTKKP
jgi:hypothetical protein